jgi:heme exporter protein D
MINWLDWITVGLIVLPFCLVIAAQSIRYADQRRPAAFFLSLVVGFYIIWQALLKISQHNLLMIAMDGGFYNILNSSLFFFTANFLLLFATILQFREQHRANLEQIKRDLQNERRIQRAVSRYNKRYSKEETVNPSKNKETG